MNEVLTPRRRGAGDAGACGAGLNASVLTRLPELGDESKEGDSLQTTSVERKGCAEGRELGKCPEEEVTLPPSSQSAAAVEAGIQPEQAQSEQKTTPEIPIERWVYRIGAGTAAAVLLYLALLSLKQTSDPPGKLAPRPQLAFDNATVPAAGAPHEAAMLSYPETVRTPPEPMLPVEPIGESPGPVVSPPPQPITPQLPKNDYPSTGLAGPTELPLEKFAHQRTTEAAAGDTPNALGPELGPPAMANSLRENRAAHGDVPMSYEHILNPENALGKEYKKARVNLSSRIHPLAK